MLEVQSLEIPEVKLVTPKRFGDARGFFSETYNHKQFEAAGIGFNFCQDNHSKSSQVGTLRGLHYQAPPFAQTKLIRVLQGEIYDVAIDARTSSPTYGLWVGERLSAENGRQLLVPKGFLHGFVTLSDDTEVAYKVDNYYDGDSDGSVIWNDKTLAIDWPVNPAHIVLSDKDAKAPTWTEFTSPF